MTDILMSSIGLHMPPHDRASEDYYNVITMRIQSAIHRSVDLNPAMVELFAPLTFVGMAQLGSKRLFRPLQLLNPS